MAWKCMLITVCWINLLISCASNYVRNQAYVALVASNDVVLGAQVLAFALKKVNATRSLSIIYTENIKSSNLDLLRQQNLPLHKVPILETPYQATARGVKFKYTKLHIWNLLQFEKIGNCTIEMADGYIIMFCFMDKPEVYLDIDTLPMENIDDLFKCGDFCATTRHSDRFNCGVMVLKPDKKIYEDMLSKINALQSYDGGDQGPVTQNVKFTPDLS